MRCSIGVGSAFPEKIGGAAQLNGELASMTSSTAPRDSRCPDALNDLDDSSIYTDVQHPFKCVLTSSGHGESVRTPI